MKRVCFVVLILACCLSQGQCQNLTQLKDLRTQLFTTNGYDTRLRPMADQSQQTVVSIALNLLTINSLSEVSETLTTTAFLSLTWTDIQLQWTPADYGNTTDMFWPQEDVWTPDVTLVNSIDQHSPLGYQGLRIHNHYTGNMEWKPFQVFSSTCHIDITFFPFDVQQCHLVFELWAYGKQQVELEIATSGLSLGEYEPNPVWDVVKATWSATEDDEDTIATFTVKIRRHPSYFMMNVFLPVLVLVILNIGVFLLPCDGGEKNSYAVTVFLSFAIFLTLVNASLPANADTTSYFQIYLIILTIQSTVITLVALVMTRLCECDDDLAPIPTSLVKLSKLVTFNPCCRKNTVVNNQNDGTKVTDIDAESVDKGTNRDTERPTWKSIVNGIDAFCLVVFSVTSFVYTFLFLVLIPSVAAAQ